MRSIRHQPLDEALLVEGLNAKDIVMDIAQVAVSSGAVAVTGGAGGDVITDMFFAAELAQDILGDVEQTISELGELASIVNSAMQLDFTADANAFYGEVKGLVKKTLANQLVGSKAKDLIEKTARTVNDVILKIVRAISKWVSALLPDDFGLGGPAFEATVSGAIQAAAGSAYDGVTGAIEGMGETGELLTDPDALSVFLTNLAESILAFAERVDDIIQNPDPDKAGLTGSILGTAQLAAETTPLVAIGAWAARKAGVETDTLGQDYLNWMEKLHPEDPRRKLAQKATPQALAILEEIVAEWIPTAVAVMRKLISILMACVAIFQMVMNPEERKELLDVKTRKQSFDLLGLDDDPIDLNLAAGRLRRGTAMRELRITRSQLRQIIKEAIDVMNSETGEVLVFDDQAAAEAGLPQPDAPEAAALDMMKRLGVIDDAKFETGAFPEYGDTPTYSLPDDKWQMMEDELYGKRAARKSKADKERLDIDNLMDRAREWAQTVAADYMADNREFEGGLEDIAWDMSDAAEMEFKEDEWNEMLYHFDFNVDDLRMFIADEIAGYGDAIEG